MDPHAHERRVVTLLVRINLENNGIQDFYVFARVDTKRRFRLTVKDARLRLRIRLRSLLSLQEAVERSEHKGATGL